MSTSLTPPQSAAVLHLVQRLVRLADPSTPSSDVPSSLESAVTEVTPLYVSLRVVLPAFFPTLPPETGVVADAAHNRRVALVQGMSQVLHGAVESTDGSAFVLSDAFPRVAGSTGAVELAQLAQLFCMTVVLSGSQTALQQLKQLPREDQMALSNLAKSQLQALSLKPRPRQSSLPSTSSVTAAAVPPPAPAAAASHTPTPAASAAADLPPGTADMVTDVAYYHNATVQLREELTAVKSRVSHLEARCRSAEDARDAWARKYQLLLGNDGTADGLSSSASAAPGNAGGGSESAGSTVVLLQKRCAEKDSTIATLKSKVEEQTTRMSAFKETLGMHEVALQALRRKLKLAEEGVMAKSTECRRLQEALSVSEDKLAVQLKARMESENVVESLRSQVTVLQLTLQEREAMEGNDHGYMPTNLSSSFVSNGSIDRVVVLENEMDELRTQRDALQKQLGVLQRQIATLPPPASDTGAVNDTLKAQVRLLEKEKEDLRQQLGSAMAQMEAAAATQSTRGHSFATLPRRSSTRFSLSATQAADEGGDDGTAQGGDSPDVTRCTDEAGGSLAEGAAQRKLRTNTRRDQTLLSALLLEYGYQNLLLQQHNVLLHRDALDAAAARALRIEESQQALAGPSGIRARGAGRAFVGSFLTRQRREIEEGLLESIIHNHVQTS